MDRVVDKVGPEIDKVSQRAARLVFEYSSASRGDQPE